MNETNDAQELAKDLGSIIAQMTEDFNYIEKVVSAGDYDYAVEEINKIRGNWQQMFRNLDNINGIECMDDVPPRLVEEAWDKDATETLNELLVKINNNISALEKMKKGINELKQIKQSIEEESEKIANLFDEKKYFAANTLRAKAMNNWNIFVKPGLCDMFGLKIKDGVVVKEDDTEAAFFDDLTLVLGELTEYEEELAEEIEQENAARQIKIASEKQLEALRRQLKHSTAIKTQQEDAFNNALQILRGKVIDFQNQISRSSPNKKLDQALAACENIIENLKRAGKTYFKGQDTLSVFEKNVTEIISPQSKDVAILNSHRNPIAETFLAVLKAIGKFFTFQWKNMYELRQTKSAQSIGAFKDAFFKEVKPTPYVEQTPEQGQAQESKPDNNNLPHEDSKPKK